MYFYPLWLRLICDKGPGKSLNLQILYFYNFRPGLYYGIKTKLRWIKIHKLFTNIPKIEFSFILSHNTEILASNNPEISMYNCIKAV